MWGARAVTSMSERPTSSAIRARLAAIPSTQNSRKRAHASVRSEAECRKLKMMTRLENVQLEVALRAGQRNCRVVADHLHRDHGERLGLRGVDLARHDRRTRLV